MTAKEKAKAIAEELAKDYPELYGDMVHLHGPLSKSQGLKDLGKEEIQIIINDFPDIDFYYVMYRYILFGVPKNMDVVFEIQSELRPSSTRRLDDCIIMWLD